MDKEKIETSTVEDNKMEAEERITSAESESDSELKDSAEEPKEQPCILSKEKIEITTIDDDKMEAEERITTSVESGSDLEIKDFAEELKEYPHVLEYIDKLHSYIKKQNEEIKLLKQNSQVQEDESDSSSIKSIPISADQSDEIIFIGEIKTSQVDSTKSFIDEIKEAAEMSVQQTGFVYDENSGLYYDHKTGYYYDPKSGLYYDGKTGIYFYYDNEKKEFKFHSQIDISKNKPDKKSSKKKNDEVDAIDREDGELTDSDFEMEVCEEDTTDLHYEDVEMVRHSSEIDPCMRIIVTETDIPNLKIGSLFIVSCKGGSIGREGDHSVIIPDINISKHHAVFRYDESEKLYNIVDLGSRNGTSLNGKRLSAAKQESEPTQVIHGSILKLSKTKLLCHIHSGYDTCEQCEPGLIQSEKVTNSIIKPSTKTLHQLELRRLKNKFGIKDEESELPSNSNYTDRAQKRRDCVGSSSDSVKTEQSSVDKSIPKDNIGFKLLSKMGWSDGESLGKNNDGLLEPVQVSQNVERAGLGAVNIPKKSTEVTKKDKRKQKILEKTKFRYEQIPDPPQSKPVASQDTVKTEQSSLDVSISKENKGFKLLSKMGWSEGTSLGKNNDGLLEPVQLCKNLERTGLGADKTTVKKKKFSENNKHRIQINFKTGKSDCDSNE
ncbi:angiogenic factor with G patch and FHA domains 1-like [Trichogramma pretiosum]|uniref:angiogenic factor with G patch and FHA domains 1-like n=1 Tax=Trichogramma pretiosum TaxID=7493 RepID=UPI0006C99C1F|nr:angiogenic factor with G patch and FHA domains 1-like [Trichogramma pretiosum]XP_014232773.1 angiogenic factor with G patch and FHA domains 1-like [Trichogramma pretiosum]